MASKQKILEALTPDGTFQVRTSGSYDWIAIAKRRSDGQWFELARGWSHESVSTRGKARLNRRNDTVDFCVTALYEPTAPCIAEYFDAKPHLNVKGVGPYFPVVTMVFSDGWHRLSEPVAATRTNLRKLLGPRSLNESVVVSYKGRDADFHAAEIMKSLSTRLPPARNFRTRSLTSAPTRRPPWNTTPC